MRQTAHQGAEALKRGMIYENPKTHQLIGYVNSQDRIAFPGQLVSNRALRVPVTSMVMLGWLTQWEFTLSALLKIKLRGEFVDITVAQGGADRE